jgi:hypothetical protein
MTLELTEEETAALTRLLSQTIDDDRYPLSPRIQTFKGILAKIRPLAAPSAPQGAEAEEVRETLPPLGITSRRVPQPESVGAAKGEFLLQSSDPISRVIFRRADCSTAHQENFLDRPKRIRRPSCSDSVDYVYGRHDVPSQLALLL